MTNPVLKDMVKIGYATDVESRRKQLSTTALPYEYEIYATYETSGKLEDKKLHKMIDNLNPDLRISKNREFFILSPEDAYELLESIATISGTKDKLKKVKTVPVKKQKTKRPPVNFFKCNIPVGAELVFSDDPSVVAVVVDERKGIFYIRPVFIYIQRKNNFPDRRRNSVERCVDLTFGKVIKRYESTNFGKNIHIDKSLCIVYYKHREKTIS